MPTLVPADTAALRATLERHQVALRGCAERKDVIAYLVKVVATEGEAMASAIHLVHLDGWSLQRALSFQQECTSRRNSAT